MKRFFSLLSVVLLLAVFSGVAEVMQPEGCAPQEASSAIPDGACAAVCARCHCFSTFEVIPGFALRTTERVVVKPSVSAVSMPQPVPQDILHVPLAHLS